MDTGRFTFKENNPNNIAKLVKSIKALPEETFQGLPLTDKTPVELRRENKGEGAEFIAILPAIYSGERVVINYPKGSGEQRASRECACFSYKGTHYKVIF